MLPVVLESEYRKKTGTDIDYKPYQFLPFKRIFDKTKNGFALKKKEDNLLIINDDHGIGLKTEAGIIVSQLLANNPGLRILILTCPENSSEWKEKMYKHFGLDFQKYNEDNSYNSDLLIEIYRKNYDFDFSKFDVQIIYGLNYYNDDNSKEMGDKLSNEYLLRVLIHSDKLIDKKDDNTPPTSASTVSSFKINKSIEECKDDKAEHLINYLCQIEDNKAVIFTFRVNSETVLSALEKAAEDKYELEDFSIYSITSKMEDSKRKSAANEFCNPKIKSILVCDYPYGFKLNTCRTAIHYNIDDTEYDSKMNGLICKADSKGDVDIVYFVENAEDKEKAEEYINENKDKLKTKEQDLKQIEAEVEEYLSTFNGSENADDKKRLEELKGEKQ